jgi:glycosyltransferase involved in cell wall biosynthesis
VATVVFDVRANHDTGVSRYGLSLLAAAAPRAVQVGWRLIAVAHPAQQHRAQRAVADMGIPVLACPDDEGFVRRSSWLRALLAVRRADLYYSAHYTVDRQCPVPFVHTIHDLTRLRHPGHSYTDAAFAARFGHHELRLIRRELAALSPDKRAGTGPVFAQYFGALNYDLASRAQRIITVSRSTANDIKDLLGIDDAHVDVVPCAVDAAVFHPRHPDRVRAVAASRGLTGPYVMYVGLTHPNKRFEWLLDRLLEARGTFPRGSRLVIVGGHAERMPRVRATLRQAGTEDFITFTGRVDDDELAALYTGAAAYVTASISEGYCLPSSEALACGTRVIATDIPALRETLGSSAHFYPAHDDVRLVHLVRDALTDRLPRPPDRPHTTGWESSGALVIRALAHALDKPRPHSVRPRPGQDRYAPPFDQALRIRA